MGCASSLATPGRSPGGPQHARSAVGAHKAEPAAGARSTVSIPHTNVEALLPLLEGAKCASALELEDAARLAVRFTAASDRARVVLGCKRSLVALTALLLDGRSPPTQLAALEALTNIACCPVRHRCETPSTSPPLAVSTPGHVSRTHARSPEEKKIRSAAACEAISYRVH